jgi:hypothetical protein
VYLAAKAPFSQQTLALDVLGVSDRKIVGLEGAGKALKVMAYSGLVVNMLLCRGDLCLDRRLAQRGLDVVGWARGYCRVNCFGGL